jgi:Protein of unknown function (DUF3306)
VSDDNFLSRWSRRKIDAKTATTRDAPAAQHAGLPPAVLPVPTAPPPAPEVKAEAPLPPVESLTFDSDFTAFMRPGVDEALKRTALKTLLQDPRFNVMDGLDVYIDDYSKADPLPDGWLEKLNAFARLGDHQAAEIEAQAKEKLAQEQKVAQVSSQQEGLVSGPDLATREEPKAE